MYNFLEFNILKEIIIFIELYIFNLFHGHEKNDHVRKISISYSFNFVYFLLPYLDFIFFRLLSFHYFFSIQYFSSLFFIFIFHLYFYFSYFKGKIWLNKDPTFCSWELREVFLCDNYLLECSSDGTVLIGYAQLSGSKIAMKTCYFPFVSSLLSPSMSPIYPTISTTKISPSSSSSSDSTSTSTSASFHSASASPSSSATSHSASSSSTTSFSTSLSLRETSRKISLSENEKFQMNENSYKKVENKGIPHKMKESEILRDNENFDNCRAVCISCLPDSNKECSLTSRVKFWIRFDEKKENIDEITEKMNQINNQNIYLNKNVNEMKNAFDMNKNEEMKNIDRLNKLLEILNFCSLMSVESMYDFSPAENKNEKNVHGGNVQQQTLNEEKIKTEACKSELSTVEKTSTQSSLLGKGTYVLVWQYCIELFCCMQFYTTLS